MKMKSILASRYFSKLSNERNIAISRSDSLLWVQTELDNIVEFSKRSGLEKDEQYSSIYLEPAHGILQRMKDEQIVFSLREMAWLMLVISRHKDAHIQACKMMFRKEAKELVKWLEKNYDDVYKELYLSLPKSCVSTAWNNMV
jgi:hypothetical protein